MLLMLAAQFGGRELELAFGPATKIGVVFADALSPAVADEGISETSIEGIVADGDLPLFDSTIKKRITPVKDVVDAHTTTGDHCGRALGGGRQGQNAELFGLSHTAVCALAAAAASLA